VDAAFQILRAHYPQLVMCAAIAYAPLILVQLVLVGDPRRLLEGGPNPLASTLPWTLWLSSLAGWLTAALMSAVLLACASQAYLGEEVDVRGAVQRVLPRTPRVLGAALLRYLLLFIGFLALFVGSLYVVARYFAVIPAVVLEDAGVFGAFSRSSQLSKGRKWHILNTLGLVGLIYLVIYFGLFLLASLVGNFVVQTILRSIVTVLIYPVVAITEALLYYDTRIQSEGLDVELMADALAPASAPN
jgi:hypothetical protein